MVKEKLSQRRLCLSPATRKVQKSFQDGQTRGRKATEGYQIIINLKGYLHLRKSQSHKSLEAEIMLWEDLKYFCVFAQFPQPSPGSCWRPRQGFGIRGCSIFPAWPFLGCHLKLRRRETHRGGSLVQNSDML